MLEPATILLKFNTLSTVPAYTSAPDVPRLAPEVIPLSRI